MSIQIRSDGWINLQRYLLLLFAAFALCVLGGRFSYQPASAASPGASDPPYVLSTAISLPAGVTITSFDISWVDPVLMRYYIANRTSSDIIAVDTTTNKVVGDFRVAFAGPNANGNKSGPDGVITVDHKEIWVGDSPSKVWVLDSTTGAQIVPPIDTGGVNRADELCYDPVDKVVAIVNNADSPPFITFISTTSKTILGKVVFDGVSGPKATNGSEQCQWNPRDGKIYLSIPEINGAGDNSSPGGVVVFDPTTRAVLRTMIVPLAACTGPQGLAIGPFPQIGLGCGSGIIGGNPATNTAIINESTGAVIAALTGVGAGDEIWYNPGNGKYFLASSGKSTVFAIDAGTFAVQPLFSGTASAAHSVAVDPVRNNVYVPVSSASTSQLCSSKGAVDANGCILVFAPSPATPELGCFTGALLGDINNSAGSGTTVGPADVIWRRDDGAVSAWLMQGTTVTSAVSLGAAPIDFNIAGVGDLNGDGTADVVWRRTSDGSVSVWLMSNGSVASAVTLGLVPTDWRISSGCATSTATVRPTSCGVVLPTVLSRSGS